MPGWRRYVGPYGGTLILKPDAFARVADDDYELWWFIEVDLGTVGQVARESQAAAYRQFWRGRATGEVMPRVLWVCHDRRTAERAAVAIRPDAEPAGLFVSATAAETIDRLAGLRHDASTEEGEEEST